LSADHKNDSSNRKEIIEGDDSGINRERGRRAFRAKPATAAARR
jgi:hypothetical protein